MIVQRETPGHIAEIRPVTAAAFGPSLAESTLVDELCAGKDWRPALSRWRSTPAP